MQVSMMRFEVPATFKFLISRSPFFRPLWHDYETHIGHELCDSQKSVQLFQQRSRDAHAWCANGQNVWCRCANDQRQVVGVGMSTIGQRKGQAPVVQCLHADKIKESWGPNALAGGRGPE